MAPSAASSGRIDAMPLRMAAERRVRLGRRARRIALWTALALGCATIAALAAREANLLDRLLVYFPERKLEATPSDLGLEYEDVYFETSDGVTLHGWYVPGADDPSTGSGQAVCVVWFHGNAGNIGHRVYNLALMHSRVGASVLLFDYRGYGRSEGSPSEPGLYLDAEAAVEQAKLSCGVGDDGIVLFGRSLGGAVAVEMATRRPFRAAVVESGVHVGEGDGECLQSRHLPLPALVRGAQSEVRQPGEDSERAIAGADCARRRGHHCAPPHGVWNCTRPRRSRRPCTWSRARVTTTCTCWAARRTSTRCGGSCAGRGGDGGFLRVALD